MSIQHDDDGTILRMSCGGRIALLGGQAPLSSSGFVNEFAH